MMQGESLTDLQPKAVTKTKAETKTEIPEDFYTKTRVVVWTRSQPVLAVVPMM